MKRYKIVGLYDDKKVTLKTVNDEIEAEETRREYAQAFTSSWTIKIEISEEII